MKYKLFVIVIMMLLIVSSISFSFTVLADWNPGDPYKMHFPQLPDPSGWDVDATYIEAVWPQNCLADDWMCTESGPVSDIHFWGSWLGDHVGTIMAFVVAIAADIPTDPPLIPYSRPGVTLWERTFYPDDWIVAGPWDGLQGYYDPGEGYWIPDDHMLYWQYNIEHIPDPFYQEVETIYWLSISAIVMPDYPQQRWGWKSSLDHWNDDAVHGFWYELAWIDLWEPPDFETSLDLAFVITGDDDPINNPPNTPSTPSGPSTGEVDQWITYTTSTTDVDGDTTKYGLDYTSDGIVDFWSTSYYASGATYSFNIRTSTPGTYYLRMKAEDIHGAQSGFSSAKVLVISGANNPPNTPITPSGPSSGLIGTSYSYSTSTTDPDGDNVKYGYDWDGDGTVDEWTSYHSSGTTITTSHIWSLSGTYSVKVKAEDSNGAQSGFSSAKTVVISSNSPPGKPSLSGPSSGRPGISYSFSASTVDPDVDQVYYWFDWDDGTNTGWIGPYNSGQTITSSHVWSSQGTYSLKVKAKDTQNAESVWSDPLSINLPKNKFTSFGIIDFIENHPRILPILRLLLGL